MLIWRRHRPFTAICLNQIAGMQAAAPAVKSMKMNAIQTLALAVLAGLVPPVSLIENYQDDALQIDRSQLNRVVDMQAAAPTDNSTEMKATQTFTPAVPAALVDPDGSLILTGPSSSSTGLSTTGLSTTGASADHLLWWVIAIIALVGIVCR